MGFHKFLIYTYLSNEFHNTWLYWPSIKKNWMQFWQKTNQIFCLKKWSFGAPTPARFIIILSNSIDLFSLSVPIKVCVCVCVCWNFFSFFRYVDINRIQKNIYKKMICTHLLKCIVKENMYQISAKNKPFFSWSS